MELLLILFAFPNFLLYLPFYLTTEIEHLFLCIGHLSYSYYQKKMLLKIKFRDLEEGLAQPGTGCHECRGRRRPYRRCAGAVVKGRRQFVWLADWFLTEVLSKKVNILRVMRSKFLTVGERSYLHRRLEINPVALET